jgi:hypothetical protein
MKGTLGLGLAVLVGLGLGCGNNEEAQQQAEQAAQQAAQAVQQAQQQAQQAQQAAQPAQPAAGAGGSNFGTVTLTSGFTPDPHVAQGTSGGSIDASTVNAACNGWISSTPDHLLAAGTPFGNLRVMTHSESDTTLVIQKPDGSYACNDDTDGLNPLVVIANAPAGTYKIWIGSYAQGENASYKLGFSELDSVTPTTLAQ